MAVACGLQQVAMMENCWWMQRRLFQLWQCVRDQAEQIDTIAPYTFYFYIYFCIYKFFFEFVCHVLCWYGPFFSLFLQFFVFFMFTVFGIRDIERRKKKVESSQASHKDLCPKVGGLHTWSTAYKAHQLSSGKRLITFTSAFPRKSSSHHNQLIPYLTFTSIN